MTFPTPFLHLCKNAFIKLFEKQSRLIFFLSSIRTHAELVLTSVLVSTFLMMVPTPEEGCWFLILKSVSYFYSHFLFTEADSSEILTPLLLKYP